MHLKRTSFFLFVALAAFHASAQVTDIQPDTWTATDALGRVMPTADKCPLRTDKTRTVGIFYITWHTQNLHDIPGPYTDVSRILHEDPSARLRDDHPLWRYGSYHWGEPEMGYFLSQDEWVVRRDMSMLADAGVDVLVLDVTNGVCYWDEWEVLFSTMTKMRAEGNQTPQFVFWSYNGGPVRVVKSLYERIYKEKRYADLWFYWDGKPLLLYNADPSYDANGTYSDASADDYPQEIRDFFTLRNMWWGYYTWHGNRFIGTEDNWSFGYSMADKQIIGMKPEELVSKHNGQPEEAAVTPAQHPVTMTDVPMGVGKSWSRQGGEPQLNEYDMPAEAYVPWLGRTVSDPAGYGIYFQERWDDALAADPPFIYLNDWNEWTAGMYERGKKTMWLGRESPYIFIDQYNAEFNRTIQPMRGGYTDNYYMQMVQNIRRYKGVRPIPVTRGYGVEAVYRDTRGDVARRNHDGYAGLHYTDSTGRNDFVECRVSVTRKALRFEAKTADALSPSSVDNWMMLLMDADCNAATGWEGYDFLVRNGILYGWDEGQQDWGGIKRVSPYEGGADFVRITVPRKLVGMTGKTFSFDFKWTDNPTALDNIITVATTGDTAPNRRFNYRFQWERR